MPQASVNILNSINQHMKIGMERSFLAQSVDQSTQKDPTSHLPSLHNDNCSNKRQSCRDHLFSRWFFPANQTDHCRKYNDTAGNDRILYRCRKSDKSNQDKQITKTTKHRKSYGIESRFSRKYRESSLSQKLHHKTNEHGYPPADGHKTGTVHRYIGMGLMKCRQYTAHAIHHEDCHVVKHCLPFTLSPGKGKEK